MQEDSERQIEAKKIKQAEMGPVEAESTIPLTGTRKTIAEHMLRSLSISAQLTAMGEIDMTEIVKLRESLLEQEEVLATRITYTDLLVFAVAKVLKKYPLINASIIDNNIKVWKDINVAVAVHIEGGVIVPVIRNADKKSLAEISQEVKNLTQRARERTLTLEEIKGGTFTISNLGAIGGGWRFDTLIINQPQSAILGTGSITERAVVRDGQIVIRHIMTYSFTYDHRLIDGAMAVQFTKDLIMLLENPSFLST
jgi:pyruvate/2-oxoglutarate dehydrogenase complex dihydrolipoamide acyltransferase (E2) component